MVRRWTGRIHLTSSQGEALVLLALLALAVTVRVPYLWDAPRFTDETAEAEIGLRIARGEILPLTNRDPYIGALWNYLLALAFALGGPSLLTPRLVVMVVGALTVVPAYLLGRSLGGRLAGTLAGLFLALSPAHVAVNSHIGWSNCVTPLFTTLGLWLAHRAASRDRPWLLAAGGLCLGLGVQTHPVAALLLPGIAASVALARPRWLAGLWPGVAVCAAMAGAANLLLANVLGGADGLGSGGAVQARYTGGEILTWAVYVERLRLTLWLLADSLGGVLVETGPLTGPYAGWAGLAFLVLAVVGIEALARRRDWLAFSVTVSFLLLLPVVNGRYESSVPKARYVAPLLPVMFAAGAVALAEASAWIGHLAASRAAPAGSRGLIPARPGGLTLAARAGLGIGVAALLLAPLAGLDAYYRQAVLEGRTNAALFQAVAGIEASRRPGNRVYVERTAMTAYTLGGGQWNEHLAFAAQVYGWDRQTIELPHLRSQPVPRIVGPLLVRTSTLPLLARMYRVEPVRDGPSEGASVRLVYSTGPRPHLLAAERQDERDDVPQPPRPPRVEVFVDGVTFPSALQFAPDGRLFFNEVRAGRVRIASPAGALQEELFVTLPTPRGLEQGALGLALDPAFAENRWVYVFYSEADAENRPTRNRLVRFTERDGVGTEVTAILGDLPVNQTRFYNGDRNGGRIGFGPDGMLYVSLGEMVRQSQVPDPSTPFGKILRVRPDGSVPPDNPYGASPTYALGFRNVLGFAFHPGNGLLYAADNGFDGYDELNLVQPGRHYGYPSIEGGPAGVSGLEDPFWDSAEERLGITGVTVYSGSLFPEYAGDLFFCTFNSGELRRVRLSGPRLDQVEWVETISRDCRLDVTTGPDGTLYFTDLARVFRLAR